MASTLLRLVYNSSCYVVQSLQAAILPSSRRSALSPSDTSNQTNKRKHSNAYRPKLILDGRKLPRRPVDVANEEMERWMMSYRALKQFLQDNPSRSIDAMPSSGLLKRWWRRQEQEYYLLTLEQIRLLQQIEAIGTEQTDPLPVGNDNMEKAHPTVDGGGGGGTTTTLEDVPVIPPTKGPATRLRSRQGPNNVAIKQEYGDVDVLSIGSDGSFHSAVAEGVPSYPRSRTLPAKRACPTPRVTPYHMQQRQQQRELQQQHFRPQPQRPVSEELQIDQHLLAPSNVPEPVQSNITIPTRQLFPCSPATPPTVTTTTTAASPRHQTPEEPPQKRQRIQQRSNQVSPSPLEGTMVGMEFEFPCDRQEDDSDEFDLTGHSLDDDIGNGDHDFEIGHDANVAYPDDFGDGNDDDDDDEEEGDDDTSDYGNIFVDLIRMKTSRNSNDRKDNNVQSKTRPLPPSRARASSKGTRTTRTRTRTPKAPKRRTPAKAKPRPANGRVIPSHRPNAPSQARPKKTSRSSKSPTTAVVARKVVKVPLPSTIAKFSGNPTKRLNHQTKFQVQYRGDRHWNWITMETMDEPARQVARSLLEKERQENRPSLRPQKTMEQRPGSFLPTESALESPMGQRTRSPVTPRQHSLARDLETTPRFMDHRPRVSPSPHQYPFVHEPQATYRYSQVTSVETHRHPPAERLAHRDSRYNYQPSRTTARTPSYSPYHQKKFF